MDAPAPLSAIETERLRDIRARLNRRAVSDAALGTLGGAAFTLLEQMGLGATAPFPVANLSIPGLIKAAGGADMKLLARLVATLKAYKAGEPKAWPKCVAEGAPQALISRRLALAGREPPVEIPA